MHNQINDPSPHSGLIEHALCRLERELPARFTYHTVSHTRDVLAEVVRFAEADRLPAEEVELLRIGAAFHDLGFIEQPSANEAIGARLAGEAMRRAGGYTDAQVLAVETMIRDTELKFLPEGPRQVPTTELSKYLCDADVSNLGRPDFFEKAELVRCEIGVPRDEVFFTGLKKFLSSHQWYTPAATSARAPGKAANSAELERILQARAW